eukprot:GHVP01057786.1.p1 GENE.GHVP01057786.1~~GHVP01057786.1.p1  ORF type:complete len:217 (-),score=22.51 GHVP01057786.1:18-668(-)
MIKKDLTLHDFKSILKEVGLEEMRTAQEVILPEIQILDREVLYRWVERPKYYIEYNESCRFYVRDNIAICFSIPKNELTKENIIINKKIFNSLKRKNILQGCLNEEDGTFFDFPLYIPGSYYFKERHYFHFNLYNLIEHRLNKTDWTQRLKKDNGEKVHFWDTTQLSKELIFLIEYIYQRIRNVKSIKIFIQLIRKEKILPRSILDALRTIFDKQK